MEENEKIAMYCSGCDSKQKVLEGEVTCPQCGSLLGPEPESEEVEEEVLGVDITEDDSSLEEEH